MTRPSMPVELDELIPIVPLDGDRLAVWVRSLLVVIAAVIIAVLTTAALLHPYADDGRPLTQETHLQLGLPPCQFYEMFHKPCPACGFTTSFSLLMHGDLSASLRANFVGTLLALIGMLYIPWSLLSIWRGRWLGVRELEPWLIRIVFAWLALMLIRWAALLAWTRFSE